MERGTTTRSRVDFASALLIIEDREFSSIGGEYESRGERRVQNASTYKIVFETFSRAAAVEFSFDKARNAVLLFLLLLRLLQLETTSD